MTRLDQNRACAQIAQKVGSDITKVKNLFIWGNHSATQFPDCSNGTVDGKPVPSLVDAAYLESEFVTTVQKRGAAVIAARKMSSAMSAAKAAGDHVRDWWMGTQPGSYVSMGVVTPKENPYGVPEGIVFSFPVEIKNKQWSIVPGFKISDFARGKLDITTKELLEEKEEAMAVCNADAKI